MVIQQGHGLYDMFGGIHHIYANDVAMAGYQNGGFGDGAVIVFDLLAADEDGHSISEGERKVVGVMHRDSQEYSATGGCGFEGFTDNSRERAIGAAAATACFQCHVARASDDYVFSTWRE